MNTWQQEQAEKAKEKLEKERKKPLKHPKQKSLQKKESKILTGHIFTKNQQKFLDALSESFCMISKAAHISGLHRNNHNNWMKIPEYAQEYEALLDQSIDFVEDSLMSNIRDGDTTAIIFYLKCKAKKRGYIDRVEMNMTMKIGKELEDEQYKE